MRLQAFDFVMPNHQIVECYVVFAELEAAKRADDPSAKICAELSNHEVSGHTILHALVDSLSPSPSLPVQLSRYSRGCLSYVTAPKSIPNKAPNSSLGFW